MSGNRDVKQLSRSLSHLLKRAVQYSIHLYMSETGKTGLTHRQFTVLLAADAHEGRSQTELVKMTGIDRSTLADLVARLMAQGYVQRRRTKDDARTNAIRLTPIGKKMLKQAQSGAEEVDRQLLATLAEPGPQDASGMPHGPCRRNGQGGRKGTGKAGAENPAAQGQRLDS